jgi:hypothetical protein
MAAEDDLECIRLQELHVGEAVLYALFNLGSLNLKFVSLIAFQQSLHLLKIRYDSADFYLQVPALSAKILVTVLNAVPVALFALTRASAPCTSYLLPVPHKGPLDAPCYETHWVLLLAKRK